MNPAPTPAPLVARVVPDLTGLDKQFDYLVPAALRDRIAVGSLVRVPLHGRRIGGWVVALGPPCPLYTSDAADDLPCVYLGGRRIIKKKN